MARRLILVLALLAATATLASAAVGSWHRAAPLRKARAAHAVVALGGSVYALGGTNANGSTVLEVERFDGRRWRAETRLPAGGLNAPAAVALNRRIYVIGGFEGVSNLPTASVHVYDRATRRWSRAAPLPTARGGHAAVVLGGRIHVLGGGNEERTLADHSVYDPANDRWTAAAPLPRSKGSPAAVVNAGRIYVIGGRSGPADFGDVDVYDPATNGWSSGPRIPARGTAGAVVYRGAIHVFGGESQASGRALNTVLRLGATWQRVSTLPKATSFARAVVFRDAVYVVGGSRFGAAGHAPAGSTLVQRWYVRR